MSPEKVEKMTEIFKNNQDKISEFLSLPPEEAVAVFSAYDLDVTVDELVELGKDLQEKMDLYQSGELSEKDLEAVAGGSLQGFANGMLVGYIILTGIVVVVPW